MTQWLASITLTTHSSLRSFSLLCFVLFVTHPLMHIACADESSSPATPVEISVTLRDGTVLTAAADAETSDQFLVLRLTSPGILLRRCVPWTQVAEAVLDSARLNAEELKKELKRRSLDSGADPLESFAVPASPVATRSAETGPATAHFGSTSKTAHDLRIQSLDVSAEVANWDRDAAIDGIRIFIRPRNAAGDVVPVSGQINIKLFGQAFMQVGGIRDNRRFDAFPALSEWTQRVCKQDFEIDGAIYQLAFRRTNPEFNRELGSLGLTHVRLSVAGEGVFAASDAMTQVRPFSVYRDWHQQLTGHRFLPAEHAGTGN